MAGVTGEQHAFAFMPPPGADAEPRFEEFDAAHPRIWEAFERFTFDRIRQGHQQYSADAIMHMVRWHTRAGTDGHPKIANAWVAYYARKFMRVHPRHRGFFRTARSKADAEFPEL